MGHADRVRIIPHEAVPLCGSYEVRFFYWDDVPGRRLRPEQLTSKQALQDAKTFARGEQNKLEIRIAPR
jgi:hypothetical protein